MDLDVVFLGTAGSMPTAQRAPAALLVRRGGERLLFDCAEGTQRQLLRSSVGLVELREIFVTHFHADHVLGLPGMFKTFALRGRELPLAVYGPRGASSSSPVAQLPRGESSRRPGGRPCSSPKPPSRRRNASVRERRCTRRRLRPRTWPAARTSACSR